MSPLVTERRIAGTIVLTASGRLDMSAGGALGRVLIPLAQSEPAGTSIVVDVSNLLYRDSGWSALIQAAKEARSRGIKIVLASPPESAMGEKFRLMRFDTVFPLFSSVEEALDAVLPPLRAWRCGDAFVVKCPAEAPVVLPGLLALSGRGWPDPPCDYWLIDRHGELTRRFEVTTWSVDDELGACVFVVESGNLCELAIRCVTGEKTRTSLKESVQASGLEEVAAADHDALRFVRSAFSRSSLTPCPAAARD